jgi:Mg/Co/Ni transporter MgtE
MQGQSERSLGDLFGDLGNQVSTLVRRELDLAKVEVGDRVGRLGKDAAMVAVGGAVIHAAVLVLLAAAVLALIDAGWDGWLAALLVAVVVGVLGALLVWRGLAAMREDSSRPSATVETMRENIEWAKEQTK